MLVPWPTERRARRLLDARHSTDDTGTLNQQDTKRRGGIMKNTIAVRALSGSESPTLHSTGPLVLGSDPSCDCLFDEPGVSKQHAELYRTGDLWWVRDLGSDGGTYLDGEPIDAEPVSQESILELGCDGPAVRLEPNIRDRRCRTEEYSDHLSWSSRLWSFLRLVSG